MYKLNLFKHAFTLDNTHQDKSAYLALWSAPETVQRLHRQADDRELFLLHDGPPYANGDLHLGHFVNKTLKDATVKFKRLQGYFAPYVPGFDCHGLPVELEVEKQGQTKDDPQAFVAACRAYALEQVALQTAQFQSFGVAADWQAPYLTLEPGFEAGAARLFTQLPGAHKRLRPVHWCAACASSLAEAEVEYKPRTSDSVVVLFALQGQPDTFLEVWTTTPYTLPANQAVAYNAAFSYVACTKDKQTRVRLRQPGDEHLPQVNLEGAWALSPYSGRRVPVLAADYVSRTGTGLVHLAPAFGMDDFRVGQEHGLAVEAWLDERGCFLPHTNELAGLTLAQGSAHVLQRVAPLVVSHERLEHEYPHCWRHKRPVFFRASQEWFLDLARTAAAADVALQNVSFVPASSRERLASMLHSRSAWCVSRNRLWGTPLVDPQNADDVRLAGRVASEGVAAWQSEGPRRTLDVWFDSGVTHELVLRKRFGRTADVYLEGSDQHRGWFQSSLLTAVAAGGRAPFRQLVTHGFVVDANGRKLSKSSGNYAPMDQLLAQMSPDVLRLWVLQQDFTRELRFSPEALALTRERYRKLRNTLRFCLQNLQDFDWKARPLAHAVSRVQVVLLHQLRDQVLQAANAFDFAGALGALVHYAETVSSEYFSAAKDALYCEHAHAPNRREAQFVLSLVLRTLLVLLAPVMPYTAEEVFQCVRQAAGLQGASVLLLTLDEVTLPQVHDGESLLKALRQVREVRAELHLSACAFRQSGQVQVKGAAQLETTVRAAFSEPFRQMLALLGCAHVVLDPDAAQPAQFRPTRYRPCACCRRHEPSVLRDAGLCMRCQAVQS